VFYRSQKELFQNGAAAFQSQERPGQVEEKQKRIEFCKGPILQDSSRLRNFS
jgi:hypothetical protein